MYTGARNAYNAIAGRFSDRLEVAQALEQARSELARARVARKQARDALIASGRVSADDLERFARESEADAAEQTQDNEDRELIRLLREAIDRIRDAPTEDAREDQEFREEDYFRELSAKKHRNALFKQYQAEYAAAESHKGAAVKNYKERLAAVAGAEGLSLPPNARAHIASMISGLRGTPAKQAADLREHIYAIKSAPLKTANLLGNPVKQAGGKRRRKLSHTNRQRKVRRTLRRK